MTDTSPSQVPSRPPHRLAYFFVVVALVAATGFVGFLINRRVKQEAAQGQRNHERRVLEEFQEVKQGATRATIWSPELATMLADDSDCVRNIHNIYLFMTDLQSPGYADIRRLTNVSEITIYDCSHVDDFLESLRGMPSVSKLFLESIPYTEQTPLSIASLRGLKSVRIERILNTSQIERLALSLPSDTTIEAYDELEKLQRRNGKAPAQN
jgi:hypothetical protein